MRDRSELMLDMFVTESFRSVLKRSVAERTSIDPGDNGDGRGGHRVDGDRWGSRAVSVIVQVE